MLWDILTSLFDTGWFFDLLEKNPAQLVIYTLIVFALGTAAGVWAGKKAKADLESRVNEKEHEITRLTAQLEGEKTRVMQTMGLLAEEVTKRVFAEEMRPITKEEIDAICK